jgi:glutathione S-transferase
MELYFSPLACSLATRMTFYEAGYEADYAQVDTKRKRLHDGGNFIDVNPLGQVPVLRTDDGELLFENTAILPYVADRFPDSKLAPAGGIERARLQQWLGFIGTELHKAIFVPMLDPDASEEIRRYSRAKIASRMGLLQRHLSEHDWLLNAFSVADLYLTVVLNWARYCGVDIGEWPAVLAYFKRVSARPAVARAFEEEIALYRAEQAQATV